MSGSYSIIESKLKRFIKKYYFNEILKGLLLWISYILVLSLSLLLIELFAYLPVGKKTVLVIVYLVAALSGLIYFIVLPLLGYAGIRNKLQSQKINNIIVTHFPEIKDQLWNIIELNSFPAESSLSGELVLASLDQKIKAIKHFDFTKAIELKSNLKFVYITLGSVLISTFLLFLAPEKIQSSSKRLVHFNQEYVKPSPFDFVLLNESLRIGKGDNLNIGLKVNTSQEFENAYINYGGNTYLMKHDSAEYYSYQFANINNSLDLNFSIEEFNSKNYRVDVIPKPLLLGFDITVSKPSYTNLKRETYNNITELIVPAGSICEFNFNTYATNQITLTSSSDTVEIREDFKWKNQIFKDQEYSLSIENDDFNESDLVNISLKVIKDEYPSIVINQLLDSLDYTRVYFKGLIEDDYGFKKLNFITSINNAIDTVFDLEILPGLLQQDFYYAFNFNTYKGKVDRIAYYFEVFDNDEINQYKSAISEQFTFVFPDSKDILDYQDNQFNSIEDILSNSQDLTRNLQQEMMDLKEKMLNNELTEWERKEVIKSIYSKTQSLEDALKNIHDKNEELNNYMNSFTQENQDLIDKQNEIQDILKEVLSDELKQMMDEFNEMLEKFNQNKMNEITEQMDISLDDLSEQLDKNLELLKKMKLEKQLGIVTDELEKHAQRQEELSQLIEDGSKPEDLIDQQKQEQEALDELKREYEKSVELNQELENPVNLYDFEKEFNSINEEFNNSLENQQKNNKKKSQNSMQDNKSNMQNLAFMMQQMMDAAFQQQAGENLADLLQILDNTVTFSFEQEKLLSSTNNNELDNQVFIEQKKLYSDFKVIKDSLYALAKREPSVDMVVNKEIVKIESSFRQIDKDLSEDKVAQAKIKQHYVLQSANNLALFLSEVIQNLQNQMASSQPGNQNCEKPGNNPNPNSTGNSLKQMQQSLQQQMEQMMQMMKDGQNQGKMNGELGKALSQQEKMQNMLQKMMNQGNVGSDAFETLKEADELLDKVKEDLVRNNLSNQTLKRNKEILTRLLEAENAENERDLDEKRQSNTAEEQRISETAKQFDNSISNNNFKEKLIKQKLVLTKFYQQKYQNYINQLDSLNGGTN